MSGDLLGTTVTAVREAGELLKAAWSPDSRPAGAHDLMSAIRANEDLVVDVLRPALTGANWTQDEHATGPMPDGDWWVVDPVGGNVNAVHGMLDWNVGVSLVRDGRPVLAVVHAPLTGETFTALAGEGARLDGRPLRVSAKTDLGAAVVGTGQAKPDRSPGNAERFGSSIGAMLQAALYVRVSVPVTHQLTQVAAGRMDLHWQFDNVRAHIAPLLVVQEAGGVVTHLDGRPWGIAGGGYLAAAPGLHAAALEVLNASDDR